MPTSLAFRSILAPRALALALAAGPVLMAATSAHALPQKMPACTPYHAADAGSRAGDADAPPAVLQLSADTAPGTVVALNQVSPAGAVSYQWGPVTWNEPALGCRTVSQVLDFWPATVGDPAKNRPTIVYFHPNGATNHTGPDSFLMNNVVRPATAAGFNVVSVEFRHPVMDQYLAPANGGKVPHQDVGLAIQWLRQNAALLHISSNNVFAFGYSRGSLALWQSLQPDMGGAGTGRPSSRVSAYVGYQSQSAYQCERYSGLFFDPSDPETASYVATCHAANPYDAQFGNAVDAVTATSLPVRIQYQQGFELKTGSRTAIQKIGPVELTTNWEAEHYPDFGVALYDAYQKAGNHRMQYPLPDVPLAQAFTGWQAFIQPLVQADVAASSR